MRAAESVIRTTHRERLAVVYVRQSTLRQVRENTESGRLQYGLRKQAAGWGWSEARIEVIDEDQGVSASGQARRSGFERLLLMVARSEVGVVLGLDSSRLARNTADWFQLLRWLRLTDTLFAKEGRLYDLNEGDSRLVLGIEGALSEEERFRIRARLEGGRDSKAARGELYQRLPAGYELRGGGLVKDPDEQVRQAIEAVFAAFAEAGSARQAALRLRERGQRLPVRLRSGGLAWRETDYGRVYRVLTHPVMGGAYAYGRSRTELVVDAEGQVKQRSVLLPRERWRVLLPRHHEGYVEWERWLAVQRQLRRNRPGTGRGGARREGRALLQGLVVCRRCGTGMTVSYGSGVRYSCPGTDAKLEAPGCGSVAGAGLEAWVRDRFLAAAGMGGVEAALRAEQRFEQREAGRLRSYRLEVERCEYEARAARRRYRKEDPDNRRVMRTLAREWEDALEAQERARAELERASGRARPGLDAERAAQRFAELGAEVRKLWELPQLAARDRKRLLATLIDEVLLEVNRERGRLEVLLRWRGGRTEEATLPLPKRGAPSAEPDPQAVAVVRRLAGQRTDAEIAAVLNAAGRRTARGKRHGAGSVRRLRRQAGLAGLPAGGRRRSEEGVRWLSVPEAAGELGTTAGTLYRWIREGFVPAASREEGGPLQVRMGAALQERFCETPPQGYVPAAQARRELGVSRQTLWERIQAGALQAKRIVRGPDKGLYVRWDDGGQRRLFPLDGEAGGDA